MIKCPTDWGNGPILMLQICGCMTIHVYPAIVARHPSGLLSIVTEFVARHPSGLLSIVTEFVARHPSGLLSIVTEFVKASMLFVF